MSALRLSLACGDYELTRALRDGAVTPEGVELVYLPLPPAEIFWRMLRHEEFHVSEMSLSAYVLERSRGLRRFVAIPVFPFRAFRHSYLFVNEGAGIERPEDLRGRRVGVPEYHMTAALWIRGLLADDYGVAASDVAWFQGGQSAPGREERVELSLPPDISLEPIPAGRTLDGMLATGELDALTTAMVPAAFSDPELPVRRLFDDHRAVELEYHRRTGIFPIMHVVVVRADVYDEHPWVARSLVKAFEVAKDRALDRFHDHAPASPLPFYRAHLEETLADFGGEGLWSYGLEANRPTLDAALRYSFEQGLSARHVQVEELFSAASLAAYVD